MMNLLLTILISFILGGVITTGLGYVVHRMLHQNWSLWFYRAHQNHHTIQYPVTDFYSEKYRSAGKDSTVILFIVAFAPVILAIFGMWFFGLISLTTLTVIMTGLVFWGWLHDYFHDQFHLSNSFWNRFDFFKEWQRLHFLHHLDQQKNFGIVFFEWDKLANSFTDEQL